MKLIILDRDGVINYDSDDYIKSPEEWRPIPGSLAAIARLHREGHRLGGPTNPPGRGPVRARGGEIAAVFFSPPGPMDGCRCRKPLPGLFEEIAERLKTNLRGVYAVGDAERD